MTILDRMKIERTGIRRPNQPTISIDLLKKEPVYDSGLATSDEYMASLSIRVMFWANRAQFDDAKRAASRRLLHILYADTLEKVDAARHAIFMEDRDSALAILEQLRTDLID